MQPPKSFRKFSKLHSASIVARVVVVIGLFCFVATYGKDSEAARSRASIKATPVVAKKTQSVAIKKATTTPKPKCRTAAKATSGKIKKTPSSKLRPKPRATPFKPLTFSAPRSGIDPKTGIQIEVKNPIVGLLAYKAFRPYNGDDKPSPGWLGFYETGAATEANQNNSSSPASQTLQRFYRTLQSHGDEDDRILFDPQFSPEGRFLLFKHGGGYSLSPYSFYILNVQNGGIRRLKPRPTNTFTQWSPDGNYIAYIMGGTQNGEPYGDGGYYGPLTLRVLNWRTGEDRAVVSNDTIWRSWSWKAPNTLLYGMLSNEEAAIVAEQEQIQEARQQALAKGEEGARQLLDVEKKSPPQPSVFEYSTQTKKSRLLIRDAYRPIASPDGKWIAFFGSEDPSKPAPLRNGWEAVPSGSSLSIIKADGTQRRALNLQPTYGNLVWRDNEHLLSLLESNTPAVGWLKVVEWSVKSQQQNTLTAVQVVNKRVPDDHYELESYKVTSNGTQLFVLTKNYSTSLTQALREVSHTLF